VASRREQKERLRAERLRREAEEQVKHRRQRLIQYGSGAAFLALCVVAVLIIISQSGGGGSGAGAGGAVQDVSLIQDQLQGIPQRGTVLGDPKSKVTVVEFGDLQCPVCQRFSTRVAPRLIAGVVRKGIANYELRQYTIIGPQSIDAARAAYAAGQQGRYWNFVALFYLNQGAENSGYVTDDFLTAIAKGAGVAQIAKWNCDLHSSKWDAVLAKNQTEALQHGFRGTPSFLVKGRRRTETYTGLTVPSLPEIEAAVEAVR
jgi:protein-disulfide isomerase